MRSSCVLAPGEAQSDLPLPRPAIIGWSRLSNAAASDPDLPDWAFRVLAGLATFCDREGACHPKIATVAERIGKGRRMVERGLRLLEQLGYVAITRQVAPGRGKQASSYRLSFPRPRPEQGRSQGSYPPSLHNPTRTSAQPAANEPDASRRDAWPQRRGGRGVDKADPMRHRVTHAMRHGATHLYEEAEQEEDLTRDLVPGSFTAARATAQAGPPAQSLCQRVIAVLVKHGVPGDEAGMFAAEDEVGMRAIAVVSENYRQFKSTAIGRCLAWRRARQGGGA